MKKYWVYGAGRNAEKYLLRLKKMINIEVIIDYDKSKQGTTILGIPVVSLDILSSFDSSKNKILISVSNPEIVNEVNSLLNEQGLRKNIDYINADRIVNIFQMISGTVSGYKDSIDGYKWGKGIDYKSRLLKKEDGDKIYRVIYESYRDRYEKVVDVCAKYNLFKNGIVYTRRENDINELSNQLVLYHEYIKPVSYCYEWAPATYKDSVEFFLELLDTLNKYELGLDDGHALNVTIHKGSFVLIDFGAIDNNITKTPVLIEFLNTQVIPYILFDKNEIDKAYMYLKNADISYSPSDVRGYLDNHEYEELISLYDLAIDCDGKKDVETFIVEAKQYLGKLHAINESTRWEGYQNDEWEWSSDEKLWSEKMTSVIDSIKQLSPRTIIDLAGNMGWYGAYLRERVDYSIIADLDTTCIGYLWNKVREDNFDNVLPVCMSLCSPSTAYYKDYAIASSNIIEPWRRSATERFECELAIALAIVHHLAFAQQLSFEEIIAQISLFTSKYLIIEFIEQTDKYIWDFKKEGFEWYTQENFEKVLKTEYEILDIRKSTPSESRWIYVAKKRG